MDKIKREVQAKMLSDSEYPLKFYSTFVVDSYVYKFPDGTHIGWISFKRLLPAVLKEFHADDGLMLGIDEHDHYVVIQMLKESVVWCCFHRFNWYFSR